MRTVRAREPWRFISSVLIAAGLLLLADAAATLLWKEPVSAYVASRQQDALETELDRLDSAYRASDSGSAGERLETSELRQLAGRFARRVNHGRAIAKIEMPSIDHSSVVVEGIDTAALRKAPGHYPDTAVPGRRGTTAVAGHRTTWGAPFRDIDDLRRGDEVVMTTPYARIVYRVQRKRIVDPTDTWVTRTVSHDRLVLTACHPLYSAAQRVVVFAKLSRAERR